MLENSRRLRLSWALTCILASVAATSCSAASTPHEPGEQAASALVSTPALQKGVTCSNGSYVLLYNAPDTDDWKRIARMPSRPAFVVVEDGRANSRPTLLTDMSAAPVWFHANAPGIRVIKYIPMNYAMSGVSGCQADTTVHTSCDNLPLTFDCASVNIQTRIQSAMLSGYDGVFFDEAPTDSDTYRYTQDCASLVKNGTGPWRGDANKLVIINPGSFPVVSAAGLPLVFNNNIDIVALENRTVGAVSNGTDTRLRQAEAAGIALERWLGIQENIVSNPPKPNDQPINEAIALQNLAAFRKAGGLWYYGTHEYGQLPLPICNPPNTQDPACQWLERLTAKAENRPECGGFPTNDGNDGKFLTVTGSGFATVPNQDTQFLISVPAGQTTFRVEVFDGDQVGGSLYDTNPEQQQGAGTCYDLYSSADGATRDTAIAPVRLDSSMPTLADGQWGTVYTGSVNSGPFAGAQASGSGVHFYILHVHLTNGACADPVTTVANLHNSFKVRATGLVSMVASDVNFSFIARDLVGPPYDVGELPNTRMLDTTYDGQFRFFIDVGSASRRMTLKDADADAFRDDPIDGFHGGSDTQTDGVAIGASNTPDITYRLLDEKVPPELPATVDPITGIPLVMNLNPNLNPSGNNDPPNASDTEELVFMVPAATTPETKRTWEWRWCGVHVENNVRVWAPFGSPVTFELFGGEPANRLSPSGARPISYWTTADLTGLLPITLGRGRDAVTVRNSSSAVAILRRADTDLGGANARKVSVCHKKVFPCHRSSFRHRRPSLCEAFQLIEIGARALPAHLAHGDELADLRLLADLAAELLTTKLNVVEGARRGEDLLAAFVYTRMSSVPEVIAAADRALETGDEACELTTDEADNVNELTALLRAINQAEVTYARPDAAAASPPPPAPSPAQRAMGARTAM